MAGLATSGFAMAQDIDLYSTTHDCLSACDTNGYIFIDING